MLRLRPFRQRQLPLTDRWFADADTRRWVGGAGWPGLILDLHKRPLGEYRGAVETGRYSWLAWDGDTAVGYVGCDTYDRCTTWDGSPGGGGVVKTLSVPTTGNGLSFMPSDLNGPETGTTTCEGRSSLSAVETL